MSDNADTVVASLKEHNFVAVVRGPQGETEVLFVSRRRCTLEGARLLFKEQAQMFKESLGYPTEAEVKLRIWP